MCVCVREGIRYNRYVMSTAECISILTRGHRNIQMTLSIQTDGSTVSLNQPIVSLTALFVGRDVCLDRKWWWWGGPWGVACGRFPPEALLFGERGPQAAS